MQEYGYKSFVEAFDYIWSLIVQSLSDKKCTRKNWSQFRRRNLVFVESPASLITVT